MIYLILIIALIILIMAPQYWAKHVLEKYAEPRTDIPGTGGELVQHLQKKFELEDLKLELTTGGDHYDPVTKTVRLSERNLNDHSLTAVAVAAHEFGHALQDAYNYGPLATRTLLVNIANRTEKIGSMALIALPLLSFTAAGPRLIPLLIVILIISISLSTIVHFVTLPVEFDASFSRALPILKEGQYVDDEDLLAVRKILKACALTYVAGSLAGLLNFWRWLRILRR